MKLSPIDEDISASQRVWRQSQSLMKPQSNEITQLLKTRHILEERIGYTFRDAHLLIEALTHGSYLSVFISLIFLSDCCIYILWYDLIKYSQLHLIINDWSSWVMP
jgi:hypothetical protein